MLKDVISKLPTSTKPSLRFQTNDFIINENNQLPNKNIEVKRFFFFFLFNSIQKCVFDLRRKTKMKQRIQIKQRSPQTSLIFR